MWDESYTPYISRAISGVLLRELYVWIDVKYARRSVAR